MTSCFSCGMWLDSEPFNESFFNSDLFFQQSCNVCQEENNQEMVNIDYGFQTNLVEEPLASVDEPLDSIEEPLSNESELIHSNESNDPVNNESFNIDNNQSIPIDELFYIWPDPLSQPPDYPYVEIIVQPSSTGFRFRYRRENRSDRITGIDSEPKNEIYPTICVRNYRGCAKVVVSCLTNEPPYR